jgi:cell division protein FtsZ
MVEIKPDVETFARIKVVGVGGGGSNAISRMVESQMTGVEFMVVNTDAQDLHHCKAKEKIHIGKNLTRGLGAGMNPEIGRQAAEENRDEIHEAMKGVDMVFVVYGAGGGTGSGAAPVIAEAAKEAGALTIGVVTKPFAFEGKQRSVIAEESIENLKERVDTLIIIQNDKLLHMIDKNTSLIQSFKIVDDVLRQGVQGISDLITKPGIVNVDFADINAIMQESGNALMGVGISAGDDRAMQAAKSAINSPLLNVSIDGAKGVLFNISGSAKDLTMAEINDAASVITESVDPNARIIFGASIDDSAEEGELRVTVIATGFDFNQNAKIENTTPSRRKVDWEKSENEKKDNTENNGGIEIGRASNPVIEKEIKNDNIGNGKISFSSNISESQKDNVEISDDSLVVNESKSDRSEGGFKLFNRKKSDSKKELSIDNDDLGISSEIKINKKEGNNDMDDTEVPAFIRKKLGR